MPQPNQVIIKISRFLILLHASAYLITAFGFYAVLQWGGWAKFLMSVFCIGYGLISIVVNYHELLRSNVHQMVISKEGLQTSDGNFYSWPAISNERITEQAQGRYRSYFLQFETAQTTRQIPISWLTKSPSEIISLIKQYKQQ